jgi:hypothetical protein
MGGGAGARRRQVGYRPVTADGEASTNTDGRLRGRLAAQHYPGRDCEMRSDWFPYVAAGAIAVATVVICSTDIRLGV